MAAKKTTTGRERTVYERDFTEPDHSLLGISLGRVASLLTLLDDLHCEALQLDYSHISEGMGQDKERVRMISRPSRSRPPVASSPRPATGSTICFAK